MNFLLALVLVFIFCVYFEQKIKYSSIFLYIIAGIISTTEIVAKLFNLPDFVADMFYPMFANGIISMAMFTLVMFVGALPDNSRLQKVISPIRGELSIIASILALGHNFSVGITSIDSLQHWSPMTNRISGLIVFVSFLGIGLMVLLLATSFKSIKAKLPRKSWKSLQKLAYVMYVIIFMQILLVSIPLAFEGEMEYIINSIVYSTTFLSYATLRGLKAFKKTKNTSYIYMSVSAYLIVIIILIAAKAHNVPNISKEPIETNTSVEEKENSFSMSTEVGAGSGFVVGDNSINDDEDKIDAEDRNVTDNQIDELLEFLGDFSDYQDGVYVGVGEGRSGSITVSITIKDGELIDIEIGENKETAKRIKLTEPMIENIIETQSLDVDVATGATFSSNGIIDAIRDALTREAVELN